MEPDQINYLCNALDKLIKLQEKTNELLTQLAENVVRLKPAEYTSKLGPLKLNMDNCQLT